LRTIKRISRERVKRALKLFFKALISNAFTKKIKSSLFSLKDSLFRLAKQLHKEFRLLRTDPFNLLIALVLPPLIIMLFTLMSGASAANPIPIKCVVVSYDSNTFINPNNYTESKMDNYTIPFVEAVNQSNALVLSEFYNATEEIYAMENSRNMLMEKEINVIIVIPVSFSEMLTQGLPGLIECVPDSSEMTKVQKNLNAVHNSIEIFVDNNNLTPQFQLKGFQEFTIPPDYNFEVNSNIILTLPLMVFGIAMVLTILVIVKEKPIARLLLTPAQRFEILLSKFITYTSILVIQDILLIIASLYTGLYLAGEILELFMALFSIGFTGMCLGLFVSALSKTKTEANQLFFAFFIVIVLLSGIFVPLDAMPPYLQAIAYILPLSHGEPMIKGVVTKGKSFFGFDFFCLIGLSVFLIVVTFLVFSKRRYEV
jgi:ABC-2 type transport system permease protein